MGRPIFEPGEELEVHNPDSNTWAPYHFVGWDPEHKDHVVVKGTRKDTYLNPFFNTHYVNVSNVPKFITPKIPREIAEAIVKSGNGPWEHGLDVWQIVRSIFRAELNG
jgi:hypothetical protein